MNILIVGAGAVGLVYGHHFANAGHQVTFLIKEKYQQAFADEKQAGLILYHLNSDKQLQKPLRLNHFSTINNWQQAQGFDLIALAISSDALRQLPLADIKQSLLKADTQLLMLQSSATDFEYLSQVIAEEKIFQGMISLISYQTDDVNNAINPPGTAYYLPPMPMPISAGTRSTSSKRALAKIVSLFNDSGIRAKAVNNAIAEARLPSAFLMTFLCALEGANWEFKRLAQSPHLLKNLSAAQQALLPAQINNSVLAALLKQILRPGLYKLLLKISPWCVPLPLEAYLKKHFLKVRPQTVMYMQEYNKLYPGKALAELNQLLHPSN